MNRIGRRTAYAMLVILALAIVWQVLGSLQTSPKETVPGGWAAAGPFPLVERPLKRKSL